MVWCAYWYSFDTIVKTRFRLHYNPSAQIHASVKHLDNSRVTCRYFCPCICFASYICKSLSYQHRFQDVMLLYVMMFFPGKRKKCWRPANDREPSCGQYPHAVPEICRFNMYSFHSDDSILVQKKKFVLDTAKILEFEAKRKVHTTFPWACLEHLPYSCIMVYHISQVLHDLGSRPDHPSHWMCTFFMLSFVGRKHELDKQNAWLACVVSGT